MNVTYDSSETTKTPVKAPAAPAVPPAPAVTASTLPTLAAATPAEKAAEDAANASKPYESSSWLHIINIAHQSCSNISLVSKSSSNLTNVEWKLQVDLPLLFCCVALNAL